MDAPEQIPYQFINYWNKRNATGIASLFVNDADFVNVVGLWWSTKEAIEKAHDYGLKVIFNESKLTLIRSKVRYLGEDVAIVHAKMKLTGQTEIEEAKNPEVRRNIFTFVCQRFNTGWLSVAAHNTDIIPGMETHVAIDGELKSADYRKK